jgi:heat shock protein HtpX
MASLYTQAAKNVTKTWILMAGVFLVVIALGWFFSYYFQNPSILIIFAIFAIVLQVVSYWYSDKVVIKLSGARPATREEFFDLYTVVENLSIAAGLPMPKVYVVEDPAPNAFATGRDKDHAVVCATTGLLAILDKSELEGVIAHELSHIGNRDMLVSTVVVVLVGFISIISDVFMRSLLWGGMRRNDDREGNAGGILMIVGIVFAILAPIVGTLMQLAISRRREYLADADGALLTRYPEGLAKALAKIGNYAAPLRHQSSAIAHIYLADPSGGKKVPFFAKLFATHPPIADRIKALLGDKNEVIG